MINGIQLIGPFCPELNKYNDVLWIYYSGKTFVPEQDINGEVVSTLIVSTANKIIIILNHRNCFGETS